MTLNKWNALKVQGKKKKKKKAKYFFSRTLTQEQQDSNLKPRYVLMGWLMSGLTVPPARWFCTNISPEVGSASSSLRRDWLPATFSHADPLTLEKGGA